MRLVLKFWNSFCPITLFIVSLCSAIYFINIYQEYKLNSGEKNLSFVVTPIQKDFFFDTPYELQFYESLSKKYKNLSKDDFLLQQEEIKNQLHQLEFLPYWRGFYKITLLKIKYNETPPTGVLFENIRKGQLWRMFSPAFLHTNFLHLLFNMLWLLMLGKMIERKIFAIKYILLILICALSSNTFQYLMSGPNFLGFSGVIMGFAGFIWERQKKAPWEGYALTRSIEIFLFGYVIVFFVIQTVFFLLEVINIDVAFINIANTAHIVGGVTGICLGKIDFFRSSKSG